ncbi:hypothetical protein [Lonepinella sp. BR2271]|uniref:hypothetical protein n=1 Tax=Lonepinella sp. BR2271 TaxID=3434550 RepID=UPI003F6E29F0
MLKNKIKLGFFLSFLFISQNVFSYGCQDRFISKERYCSPDGTQLFWYGEITPEMKKIKSTFRGKTYTYKDLIQPLDPNELIGLKDFEKDIKSFNNELKEKLNTLEPSQLKQILDIRGDYVEKIFNNKLYSHSILNNLVGIDNRIIFLLDKFKLSKEKQDLFKIGAFEKHKSLEIMINYINYRSY